MKNLNEIHTERMRELSPANPDFMERFGWTIKKIIEKSDCTISVWVNPLFEDGDIKLTIKNSTILAV